MHAELTQYSLDGQVDDVITVEKSVSLKWILYWKLFDIQMCLMLKRFWKSMVKSSNATKNKIRWGWLNFDSSFQQKLLAVKTFTVIDVCLHTPTKYHCIINDLLWMKISCLYSGFYSLHAQTLRTVSLAALWPTESCNTSLESSNPCLFGLADKNGIAFL